MLDFDPSKIREAFELAAAGAIGTLVSLRFQSDIETWGKRITAVLSGAAAANYVTPLLVAYLDIDPTKQGGVAFLLGLFGMAVVGSLLHSIKGVDLIEIIKNRFGGGS